MDIQLSYNKVARVAALTIALIATLWLILVIVTLDKHDLNQGLADQLRGESGNAVISWDTRLGRIYMTTCIDCADGTDKFYTASGKLVASCGGYDPQPSLSCTLVYPLVYISGEPDYKNE